MNKKLTIGLYGESTAAAYQPLFKTLSRLFPVTFHKDCRANNGALRAAIVLTKGRGADLVAVPKGPPVFVAVEDPMETGPSGSPEVRFGSGAGVEQCLKNQTMEDADVRGFCPLVPVDGDEVIASRDAQPIWVRRNTERGVVDLVAAFPPAPPEDDYLCAYLRVGRFMRLLPLVIFLKRLTRAIDWQCSRRRACFIFDDPSLYWPSYGFLDFRRLAEHVHTHRYYASIATVPLDTWWSNPAVVAILRAQAPRLSLLPHGNDHLKYELSRPRSEKETISLLAQALSRFERLERHEGLEVCRVMEAPHGAMSVTTLQAARQLGYEAVLATAQLLLRHNRDTAWPRTLGLEMTDMLVGGLPAIPRIKMSTNWKTGVLLAALLDQPIVLVGHHPDAVDGLEFVAEYARIVNGIGDVSWASPQRIIRSNYKERCDGETLHINMYSRRISFIVPENVQAIQVHRPWITTEDANETLTVNCGDEQRWSSDIGQDVAGPIPARPGEAFEVASSLKNAIDYRTTQPPSLRVWPVLRKVLMEARDRTSPFRPRKQTKHSETWP